MEQCPAKQIHGFSRFESQAPVSFRDYFGAQTHMSPDCHLSFVVTTRNDNHGGDMLRRFQIFAETLLQQANRHSLKGELIVVEWNRQRNHDFMRF